MPRTSENLSQHELIGLEAEVISSPDNSQKHVSGEVMDETQNTITIGSNQIPKQGRTFRFKISDTSVELEGNEILERPEDRL